MNAPQGAPAKCLQQPHLPVPSNRIRASSIRNAADMQDERGEELECILRSDDAAGWTCNAKPFIQNGEDKYRQAVAFSMLLGRSRAHLSLYC